VAARQGSAHPPSRGWARANKEFPHETADRDLPGRCDGGGAAGGHGVRGLVAGLGPGRAGPVRGGSRQRPGGGEAPAWHGGAGAGGGGLPGGADDARMGPAVGDGRGGEAVPPPAGGAEPVRVGPGHAQALRRRPGPDGPGRPLPPAGHGGGGVGHPDVLGPPRRGPGGGRKRIHSLKLHARGPDRLRPRRRRHPGGHVRRAGPPHRRHRRRGRSATDRPTSGAPAASPPSHGRGRSSRCARSPAAPAGLRRPGPASRTAQSDRLRCGCAGET